jgi:hypothetical protein
MLRQSESGENEVYVGASLNLAKSTIRTTTKNADNIRAYTPTTLKFSATEVTHSRSYLLEEHIIIRIFAHIKEGKGDMPETFTANRSRFNIFKNSTSLHSTHIIGEAACADTAQAFPAILKASTE